MDGFVGDLRLGLDDAAWGFNSFERVYGGGMIPKSPTGMHGYGIGNDTG